MTLSLDGLPSLVLWVGVLVLFFPCQYLVLGYFICCDHAENLVYKERGRKSLNFYIIGRFNDEKCEGVDIHVLTDVGWEKEMPDWAKDRKEIIVRRLIKSFPKVDNAQVVEYKNEDETITMALLFPPRPSR